MRSHIFCVSNLFFGLVGYNHIFAFVMILACLKIVSMLSFNVTLVFHDYFGFCVQYVYFKLSKY